MSVSTWFTVTIGTSGELIGTIFFSMEKMLFINSSINDVPRRTGTATFLKTPNMTRMRLFHIRKFNTIVSTTSSFWLFVRFSHGLSQWWIDDSQLGSTRSPRGRLGLEMVLKTLSIGCMYDVVRAKLKATL